MGRLAWRPYRVGIEFSPVKPDDVLKSRNLPLRTHAKPLATTPGSGAPGDTGPQDSATLGNAPTGIIGKIGDFIGDKVIDPAKRIGRKAWKATKGIARGTLIGLQVSPSIITLSAAAVLSKAEGWVGGRKLSAIQWLQRTTPGLFNHTLDNIFKVIGNSTVNSTGLSVDDLIEIEEHIYKSLAPEVLSDGSKRPADFISQLAESADNDPNSPRAAFVYLGSGRKADSKEVMRLWNSDHPPTTNPYPKENDLHRVWEVLEEKVTEKKLPVFIDLDGDANTYTSTEYISKEIMNSMVTRHNDAGDGFQNPGQYYSWLKTRQESLYQTLDPWMKKQQPKLHKKINEVKERLTPPWLGGKSGLGPWPTPANNDRAFKVVDKLAEDSSKDARGLGEFADMVTSLDRDIVTATMTHWIKLLKGVGSEKRAELLEPLSKAWVNLNVGSIANPELAIPKGAPRLLALEGPPPEHTAHPYDRANALAEVVDHTLDGLGPFERKAFMGQLKGELGKNLAAIQGQDQRFAALLGDRYEGMNFAPLLKDRHSCNDKAYQRKLAQLKATIHSDNGFNEREQAELHRHYVMADWLVNSTKRYGDVQVGLLGNADAFKEHPLGVSQYFDQMEPPKLVTMLGRGPGIGKEVGNAESVHTMKVSIFREGGGGKGMAYPAPARALKAGLTSLNYQLDDGGGNSAGCIPELLEAAGFNDDEIEKISTELDFKEFNADAIPLLGGTDPKIGGINHTGLFSSQKMYKDLHGIISKKLGIEGRPVLFRDLPRRYALTATVMNTDLPADDPLRKLIDNDKRMVMSSEATPNFDVIGAVTASTAVPAYFNAPQLHVARTVPTEDGKSETKLHRIQFVDGGVVDNFPVNAARRDPDDKPLLVVVPAYFETIDENGNKVSLSTLNFDDENVEAVNKENRAYYEKLMPKLDAFLGKAAEEGYNRVVLAMNLSDLDEQREVVIQGQSKDETKALLKLADSVELDHMSSRQGRKFMEKTVNAPGIGKRLAGGAFNIFLDGTDGEDNEYAWKLKEGSTARVGSREEENLLEVIRGVGSSAMATNKAQEQARLFEKNA